MPTQSRQDFFCNCCSKKYLISPWLFLLICDFFFLSSPSSELLLPVKGYIITFCKELQAEIIKELLDFVLIVKSRNPGWSSEKDTKTSKKTKQKKQTNTQTNKYLTIWHLCLNYNLSNILYKIFYIYSSYYPNSRSTLTQISVFIFIYLYFFHCWLCT